MPDFKLSAQLTGHDSDVRAVCFPSPDVIISASRDRSVRVWRKISTKPPPTFEVSIICQAIDFVNSLTVLPPTPENKDGLVISGGKDSIIEVRKPTSTPTDNAERLLIGHAHNICTLDVSPQGKYLVSGGWDGQARVWSVGKWESELLLSGHEDKSVWAVLALDENTVVTGCADNQIRVFDLRKGVAGEAEPLRTIYTPDVVRALCRVPKGHSSGADIASASNDGVIRLWKLSGRQVGELHGHESFIYSLAALQSAELVSAGEDRTVRIWNGQDCVQTITHPAISVWAVAVCAENGDIVTGTSDGRVRVFTRSEDRLADSEVLRQFDESVKSSAIPEQQVGSINKEKLPGPEFLKTKSGTKEGQVQMIKEDNGSITAHTWSTSVQQWVNVGTVVDAVGSSGRKVEYNGQSYDYVFDVDIEEGKPALKLPYNLSENPYERAQKFLGDNDLPISYLDQVANFIVQNTKGASIGEASQPVADPYGTESRYRPGDGSLSQPQKKGYLPHEEYISLTQAKFEPIQRKILSINSALIKSGEKDNALNPDEESILKDLVASLNLAYSSSPTAKLPAISDAALTLVLKLVRKWAYKDRLPGLDLLRCMVSSPVVAGYTSPRTGGSIVDVVLSAALEPEEPNATPHENYAMMALRTVANLFATELGRTVAVRDVEVVLHTMERVAGEHGGPPLGLHNRNVGIALTTAAFNYMCLAYLTTVKKKGGGGSGAAAAEAPGPEVLALMANVLQRVLREQTDSEVVYRALMAVGMVLAAGGEYKDMVTAVGVEESVRGAVKGASDARVKEVGSECLVLMR